MNAKVIAALSLVLLLRLQSVSAESANEQDFKQLRAFREKAATEALEPINHRYKVELDKIFRRATQAGELNLALQIQAEIQAIGGAVAAKAAEEGGTGSPSAAVPMDKTDLRKLIENSEWLVYGFSGEVMKKEPNGKIVFGRNGKCISSGSIGYANDYVIEAPDIVKTFGHDPKKEPKAEHHTFRVNMAEKTATKDLSLSTTGGNWFLKYSGPAKLTK